MRYASVLAVLALVTANVLAQQQPKFEVTVGIGTDIVPSSGVFKNHLNLSASLDYSLTEKWALFVCLGQQDYRLDHLTSAHQHFLDYRTPSLAKTVTSILVGGRNYITNRSAVLVPFTSVALGYAQSTSSPEGYIYVQPMYKDTVYQRVRSGHLFFGHVSLGIQVHPMSFIDLSAELQVSIAPEYDILPSPLAGKVGLGILF
jgi:hypothetical protein